MFRTIILDDLLKFPGIGLCREQIIQLVMSAITQGRYVFVTESFRLGNVKEQKNRNDDTESEKDVCDLCTQIGGVGIDDIRENKSDDPVRCDLTEPHKTLDCCTKRKTTDLGTERNSNRTKCQLFKQNPISVQFLECIPEELPHDNDPLGGLIGNGDRSSDADYETSDSNCDSSRNK